MTERAEGQNEGLVSRGGEETGAGIKMDEANERNDRLEAKPTGQREKGSCWLETSMSRTTRNQRCGVEGRQGAGVWQHHISRQSCF